MTLTANPTGGAPPYTYLWSTGETTASIVISPTVTTTYTVTTTDACLNESVSENIEIIVPDLPPMTLNVSPDITEICPYLPRILEANPSGGSGNYTYYWSSNSNPNLGGGNAITVTPSTTTMYTINVTDNCGNSVTDSILYTITSPPLILEMSPAQEVCPGDSAFISVQASGGYGQYFYYWSHSGDTTPGIWVNPYTTTTYEVIVSDECQTFTVEGTTTVTVVAPFANFSSSSTTYFNGLPITFINESVNGVDFEWDFGDGNTDNFSNPSNTYNEPGTYLVTLIAIDEKGCTDTIIKPINIEDEWFLYVPNSFTPDDDRFNNTFEASTIGVQSLKIDIFNRWGEVVYQSNDSNFIWNGTYNDSIAPDGTYTYSIEFITDSGRNKTQLGHVNLLR